jgi:hypothetical protein
MNALTGDQRSYEADLAAKHEEFMHVYVGRLTTVEKTMAATGQNAVWAS